MSKLLDINPMYRLVNLAKMFGTPTITGFATTNPTETSFLNNENVTIPTTYGRGNNADVSFATGGQYRIDLGTSKTFLLAYVWAKLGFKRVQAIGTAELEFRVGATGTVSDTLIASASMVAETEEVTYLYGAVPVGERTLPDRYLVVSCWQTGMGAAEYYDARCYEIIGIGYYL